jgi:hypothetical protein
LGSRPDGLRRVLRRLLPCLQRGQRRSSLEPRCRWRIDGSATVLGNVVYYSDLGSNTTAGLDLRSGRKVFGFSDGEFTPVITDGKVVFLIGFSTIYQMLPPH